MKKLSSIVLVLLLSFVSLHADFISRQYVKYPTSERAITLINKSYELQGDCSSCGGDGGAHFFRKYGIEMGKPDGCMYAYDGECLMIFASKREHEKIALILQVVEEMAQASIPLASKKPQSERLVPSPANWIDPNEEIIIPRFRMEEASVRRFATSLEIITRYSFLVSEESVQSGVKLSLDCENVTMRGAMDVIAREALRKGIVFTELKHGFYAISYNEMLGAFFEDTVRYEQLYGGEEGGGR